MRFTFCALASTGRNVRFDLSRTEGYRNFCNKLWNAARFVLMNAGEQPLDGPRELGLADRWIRSRAKRLVRDCRLAVETFRFDLYAGSIYEFAWHEYCDWYLELSKPLLWDDSTGPDRQTGTRRTLVEVLELLLRVAHPVLPFITEAIWRDVAPLLGIERPSIMLEPFPQDSELSDDPEAEAAMDWLKGVVTALRNIRGEAGIKPGRQIDVLLRGGDHRDRELAATTRPLLERLAKVGSINWLPQGEQPPANALALVGELNIMVPLAGLIDIQAERARIAKEIDRKGRELRSIETKLGNDKFVQNAPPHIVEKERTRASDARATLAALQKQLDSLA